MEDEKIKILEYILSLHTENEWIEYKHNNTNPDMIGEYISALSNSAILEGQDKAYLIYGVDNASKEPTGTTFDFKNAKKGNQELENYLATQLEPRIDFKVFDLYINNNKIVMFEIDTNSTIPVKFKSIAYVRINSVKQKLIDFPEKERKLWRCFDTKSFESKIALDNVQKDDIFELLDYDTYFKLTNLRHNLNKELILEKLLEEKFIVFVNGIYKITNLGVLVLAKDLTAFKTLRFRVPRVIVYAGNDKLNTISDIEIKSGYAVSFETLVDYIFDKLDNREVIENAYRENIYQYPKIAIRETVANAIIHQDFSEGNKGPTIEIFRNRIEITNSGKPLIDTDRFIDHTPKSRNEELSNIMRLLKLCEEKGSGVDKVVSSIEAMYLPAPEYEEYEDSLRVILYPYKEYAKLTEIERLRATYQHCSVKYVNKEFMTNSSLRERFKIDKVNSSMVSRILALALKRKLIKDFDPENKNNKAKKYIPYWA